MASWANKPGFSLEVVAGHRVGVVVEAEWMHIDLCSCIWTVPARKNKEDSERMKSGRQYALRLPRPLMVKLRAVKAMNANARYVFESPTTTGHISPNALLKIFKRYDPSLTNHGFRNAIKEFCRRAEPPVPDHIADAFCDHSLRGLDASSRRTNTFDERGELAARLFYFVAAAAE